MVEARRSLVTILMSGYPGYKDDFASWLADAFLTKSGETSELTQKVHELLSAHPVG